VDAVTAADIKRVAGEILRGPLQMAVIGPFPSDAAFRSAMQA
jgi:predicted Zn-dependent peptidase